MFILWFAVGMWHGGAWKFIMGSGLIHWAYIVLGEAGEPLWKKLKAWCRVTDNTKWFALWQQIRTFLLVSASFVFFRASSFTDGLHSYRQMFADFNPEIFWNGSLLSLGLNGIELVITVIVLLVLLAVSMLQEKKSIRDRLSAMPLGIRWVLLYIALFGVIFLGYYGPGYNAAEFIYRGF